MSQEKALAAIKKTKDVVLSKTNSISWRHLFESFMEVSPDVMMIVDPD